ncbi:MAG TPA: S41 family peptidase [Limnochordia bacterium]|nr:S41 family peptidase [Limnochordia bacterium]
MTRVARGAFTRIVWAFVALCGLFAGSAQVAAAAAAKDNAALFDAVVAAVHDHYYDPKLGGSDWSALTKSYRDQVLQAKDTQDAYRLIDRMLSTLGDDGTYAVPPAVAKAAGSTDGNLHIVGVGMLLGQMSDGEVIVRRVVPHGPADRGGVHAGDRIAQVDGTAITGHTLLDVTDRIRGERGSKVKLSLLAPNDAARTVSLVRASVEFSSQVSGRWLQDDIGYISIPQFRPGTEDDVLAQLRKLHDARGLVLDLRESFDGGDNQTALRIAGLFTDQKIGAIVTRDGAYWLQPITSWQPQSFFSGLLHPPPTELDRYTKRPLVVLIDDTSALDVLAAGLRSADRAELVGRPIAHTTGSQQQSFPLPGGGELWVTTAHYVTTSGRPLIGGVVPDVAVPFDQAYLRGWASGTDPDILAGERTLAKELAAGHAAA